MEKFLSKRNQVFLHNGVVIKKFSDCKSAAIEANLLQKYYDAGLCVPRILEQKDMEIVMEYIPGETIPDFLARMEASPDKYLLKKTARELCNWFICFYSAVDYANSGEIRGDVNGRNFIITAENRVISVDFEERVFGTAEQDIGSMLAFIRTYSLDRVLAKRLFARSFKQEAEKQLGLSSQSILKSFCLELKAMKERRKKV